MKRVCTSVFQWLIAAGILFIASPTFAAENLPAIKPIIDCSQLASINFNDKIGEKVAINSASSLKTDQGMFCQIKATIGASIGVEIALPQQQWTQRFLQVGCGGLCGQINLTPSNASGCAPATRGEFVVAATDMGHSGGMMDASWAEDPQKRIDFAYRANHLTALLAKAAIQSYYGQSQKYAYFMGCSDGGREALMEAQRFPEDFDGISAGAPAAFFQFQNSFFHGWNVVANQRSDGSAILLQDRLPILHRAVLKHCPTLSGVNDGLLANPYACTFSPDWVQTCTTNQADKSNCLTAEEINVAQKLYRGANDSAGNQFVIAGLPLGSELRWPVPATSDGHSMSEMMVLPALQSLLLPGGKQNITTLGDFPLNKQNFAAVAQLAPLYNAANTNLSGFMKRNGKLIMWHGLADDSVSPAFSIAYYRGVEAYLGEQSTEQFVRLFLLPGVGHCGGGEGLDQLDLLSPLMKWTEQHTAPKALIAGKSAANAQEKPAIPAQGNKPERDQDAEAHFHGVQRASSPVASDMPTLKMTRPVFPYPYIAKYSGSGSPDNAENYIAVKSTAYANLVVEQPASEFIGPDNQKTYVAEGSQLKAQ